MEMFYQANLGWILDHTKNQWVDLGIHTEACMAQPDTYDQDGGAISLWVNMLECGTECGIISSIAYRTTGSRIAVKQSQLG